MAINIFLLGITGYIGSSIATRLLTRKDEFTITALVRAESKIPALEGKGIKVVKGSLSDVDVIRKEAYSADVTIHTANCDDLDSAQAIAEAILQKFKDTGKKNIYIQTSGTGLCAIDTQGNSLSPIVYDDANEKLVSEIPVTNPHRHVDTYLLSTLASFPLVIVAPSLIYGFGDQLDGISNPLTIATPIMARAFVNKKQGQRLGKGLNAWSIVSIQDTADFYILVLEKLLKGELKDGQLGYYFLENGEINYDTISHAIADALYKKGIIPTKELKEVNGDQEVIEAFEFPYAGFFGTNSRVVSTKARRIGWNPKDSDYTRTLDQEIDFTIAQGN